MRNVMMASERCAATCHRVTAAPLRQGGQAIAELVIIAPVMLLLMLVAVDFGRLFFSYISVQNAAREATSYAALHAADTPYDWNTYRASVGSAGMNQDNVQAQGGEGAVSVSDPVCYVQDSSTTMDCHAASYYASGIGNQVVVTATQPFTFMTPIIGDLFFGGSLTLTAASRAPIMNPPDVQIGPGPTQPPVPTPTPSPTSSPSPAPTLPPGATPTPTLTPTPTPIPTCTVPNFVGSWWDNVGGLPALQVWSDAGFTGALTNQAQKKLIESQTLPAGTAQFCSSSMSVDDRP